MSSMIVKQNKQYMKNILIYCAGLMLMTVTLAAQSGNVGVGTTSPTAKLHVTGDVRIEDGTQGAGKVLTSDADGRASWQTISTSSTSSPDSVGVNGVVWIGCNAWSTRNLDVSTYRNGDPIPHVTNFGEWSALTTGAYCYYANDSATYAAVYGKLYNWYAVNDPRGLAPEGWHIPSDFEWTTMINTLGGNATAGGMMKAIGTDTWNGPNLGATNLCNFSALPGGRRNTGGAFGTVGNNGNWWTSTKGESDFAWSRRLNNLDTEITGAASSFNFGYSVRCVKD